MSSAFPEIREQRTAEKPAVEYRAYYAEPDDDRPLPREIISPTFDAKKRIGDLCYIMGKRVLPVYFRVTRRNKRRAAVARIAGAIAFGWMPVLTLLVLLVLAPLRFILVSVAATIAFLIVKFILERDAQRRLFL